ncbi:hypothetical protein CDAR_262391 [Caerostris darwini]|uniref:Uncharacterized protein n=1 Tax=Caerostris darwini TaxID=1538125 RepID=A0AAV4UWY8_9ARAC|nr:hypothetical protein CDAR_262391 [Caerostris darwini]
MLPNISCKSLTITCGFENSCPGEFACGHLPCSSLYASQHFLQNLSYYNLRFENSCPGEFACGHLPCSSLYASQHFLQSLTITCGFENSCPGEFACGHLPCSSLYASQHFLQKSYYNLRI